MNRGGFKIARRVTDWLFDVEWNHLSEWPDWALYIIDWTWKRLYWFAPRHVFNPWACPSCEFEARCGYESKEETEIADAWRREHPEAE